jgi:N-acetylglucosaminyldiphosphoundecaprenol N-acetyl-beta-D-mannosaminyltransferase
MSEPGVTTAPHLFADAIATESAQDDASVGGIRRVVSRGPRSIDVLGTRVDAITRADAADRVTRWALRAESRSVAVATVNNVMEGHDDPDYLAVMRRADLITADGMPLVWALKLFGAPVARRVAGTELTLAILRRAAPNGIPVGFFGGTPEVLDRLRGWAEATFPGLDVAFIASPPFRPLSEEEEEQVVADIAASGARIVFVGLGCPKQELWMDRVHGRLPAVTVGVGAAFDFLSGSKRRAPRFMQRAGLEWAFRLGSEPRRLWRRYARHNPRFVALFIAQLLHLRIGGRPSRRTRATQTPKTAETHERTTQIQEGDTCRSEHSSPEQAASSGITWSGT